MKIVCIKGGLGNQMFQYAFAIALKKHFPEEDVFIDTSFYKGYYFRQFELERIYNLSIPKASIWQIFKIYYPLYNYKLWRFICKFLPSRKTFYKEKRMFAYFEDVFKIKNDCYFFGSWQNEKYFRDYRIDIVEAFTVKIPLRFTNQQLIKRIVETNSVSIHVRRGDFLLYNEYKGICEVDYYKKAIDYIKSRVQSPLFYIFSTDEEWCMDNLVPLCPDSYKIVNWNKGEYSYEDMVLMSKCKHNIIAHSSFSWWAAWLNPNDKKIVIAPEKWINLNGVKDKPQLNNWILING